ncbi:hypothetical protein M0804_013776 [Polistes exclamans]|nr:hypothetical protein M0804_013776 [Polistes exclamans]
MAKCCSFISCKSDSKSERKKNNDFNIRQTSFHKIPKNFPASELFLNPKQQTCQEKHNKTHVQLLFLLKTIKQVYQIVTQNEDSSLKNNLVKFTNDNLLQILNTTMLPPKRSWIFDVINSQNIFLFFTNLKPLTLKLHVKIHGILKIKIRNMKTNISTDFTFNPSSIDVIFGTY